MKICIIISTLGVGGLEKQTISLANELAQSHKYDVTLYVIKEDVALISSVHTSVNVVRHSLKETAFLNSIQALKQYLENNTYDRILVEESYAVSIATLATIGTNIIKGAAVVMHTTILPNWQERLKNVIYRHMINRFQVKVFVSYAQKDYWMKKYHISGNCQVIQNSIDTDHYQSVSVPTTTLQALRDTLAIQSDDLVLVKIARVEKEKNDALMIDVVYNIVKLKKPVKLLIVGDGNERAAIEQKVKDLHLEKHVFILGKQTDVRPYVALADAGVLPSYATETFSLAALEIMSMGKPMVMSDIGGAREIVDHQENGFIFESQNKQQLESIVHTLLDMKQNGELNHLSKNARKKILDQYTMSVMIQKYNNLICNIMQKH